MVARKGYKLTEVGEIPEDWEVVPLDSIARVTSGKRLPVGFFVTKHETPHPYVRVSDMLPGKISTENIMYVPTVAAELIKKYRIYDKDLFISVAGTLGIVGKISAELDGANLTENADRITEIKCEKDFLLYVLLSPFVQSVIESIRTVGAQPKLALERIRKFDIPFPPTTDEQTAIATALSDADALIDALEQCIAKKRHIKQGAMQELLTGKRRLSGFVGEWVLAPLCAIGKFLKGRGITREEANSGDIPCIRYGEIYTYYKEIISSFNSFISEDVAGTATILQCGDILFACSGETKEEIGKSVAYTKSIVAYAGGDIIILRSPKADSCFLGYALNTQSVIKQKAQRGQGDAIVHISSNSLGDIEILLPPTLDEQTAIAAVLTAMDDEIAALEAKLSKAKQIKAGMMQELLTGRTRLV